jgi:hypothetical protein
MFKLFLQPDISMKISRHTDLTLSCRFSLYNNYLLDQGGNSPMYNYNYNDEKYYYNYFDGKNQFVNYFIEPGITLREGSKYFKFYQQIVFPIYSSNSLINYRPFCINIGFYFSISEITTNIRTKKATKQKTKQRPKPKYSNDAWDY